MEAILEATPRDSFGKNEARRTRRGGRVPAVLYGATGTGANREAPPAAFREFPINLIKELQRRDCTIPQETYSKKRSNVIKGAFAKPGQCRGAL